jgi:ABC-type phosphate transport system auxiliary subunit
MEDLLERLKQAERQIAGIQSKVARRDLVKMLKPINTVLNRLSQESVECRRLHRPTARYQTLEQEAENLVKNLEKYLVFACLLGG